MEKSELNEMHVQFRIGLMIDSKSLFYIIMREYLSGLFFVHDIGLIAILAANYSLGIHINKVINKIIYRTNFSYGSWYSKNSSKMYDI